MSAIYPVNEQVTLDNPYLPKLVHQINRMSSPIVVPVIENPLPLGNCYWNVDAMVKQLGGSMVLGWDVSLWPNSHLAAVHHAIYKGKNGELFDLSEKIPGSSNMRRTVFIPDNKLSINLDRLPSIGMHFLVINSSDAVKEFIDSYRNLNSIEKEYGRALYDFGFRCEPNKDMAQGLPPCGSEFSEAESLKIQQFAHRVEQAKYLLGIAIKKLKLQTGMN